MEPSLWNPRRFVLPETLVLIPNFWSRDYYRRLQGAALKSFPLLGAEILVFPGYALIKGFLGYPHILTLLELVEGVREKRIFFLGTAGSLTEQYTTHTALAVSEISSGGLLEFFSPRPSYEMMALDIPGVETARGVTIDIIQRETASWLNIQQQRGMGFVEMEIFAIRAWLERPFAALVVLTDCLTDSGIRVFHGYKSLEKEFIHAFEIIAGIIGAAPLPPATV